MVAAACPSAEAELCTQLREHGHVPVAICIPSGRAAALTGLLRPSPWLAIPWAVAFLALTPGVMSCGNLFGDEVRLGENGLFSEYEEEGKQRSVIPAQRLATTSRRQPAAKCSAALTASNGAHMVMDGDHIELTSSRSSPPPSQNMQLRLSRPAARSVSKSWLRQHMCCPSCSLRMKRRCLYCPPMEVSARQSCVIS